jgi:hypothetical protein
MHYVRRLSFFMNNFIFGSESPNKQKSWNGHHLYYGLASLCLFFVFRFSLYLSLFPNLYISYTLVRIFIRKAKLGGNLNIRLDSLIANLYQKTNIPYYLKGFQSF